ncbi:MAG: 16S rRNA (cytosine1402-N4)-methyltransferase [Bacteriovoracaceae bacterium]|jgi:16S rRNA (cytosine1402-N4)-methyltransferase
MTFEFEKHISVMRNEIVENIRDNFESKEQIIGADLTFGGGGHVFSILEVLPKTFIYGVDQDPDAIENGKKKIEGSPYKDQIELIYSNFVDFPGIFNKLKKHESLDFITLDLGVSSHQFDKFERGFSYREDGPLDMRMNYKDDEVLTASDIVNTYEEEDLANLIFKYGEERLSRRIAKNIVEKRREKPFLTTKDLEETVFLSYPARQRHKKPHPATRTFQALRIAVNRELDVVSDVIPQLYPLLNDGGIIQIISFHSLEDRIVKWSFKDAAKEDDQLKILTKKPVLPTQTEILNNPRARSAKLRVIKKITS